MGRRQSSRAKNDKLLHRTSTQIQWSGSQTSKLNMTSNLNIQNNETYPEYIAAHINLGMCCLLTGEYEKGWSEYEWRLKLPEENHSHELKKPQWQGESLEGKKFNRYKTKERIL